MRFAAMSMCISSESYLIEHIGYVPRSIFLVDIHTQHRLLYEVLVHVRVLCYALRLKTDDRSKTQLEFYLVIRAR